VADEPGRPAAAYREALRRAEAACRISPNILVCRFTLGVAQYRAGYLREALASLQRALDNYREASRFMRFSFGVGGSGRGTRDPNDLASSAALVPPDFLAYQAMAHHRLGELPQARAALELMRKNYEASSMVGDRRFRDANERGYSHPARLREAEALILGPPPELPEDVFAHWLQPASDGAESSTVHIGSPERSTREASDVTGPQQ
jgi:tetratricopeptide (TPR) repeat protein